MADLTRFAQPYGELLQTLLDWQYVEPRPNWPRGPLQELVVGGSTESLFQLGWEPKDKLLVMTITYPDNSQQQFVHAGGSGGLFTAFANAALYADQRRAQHLVSLVCTSGQLPRLRELVEQRNAPDADDRDPEEQRLNAAFYDEHPDLAPDSWNEGPELSIVEEKDLGDGVCSVQLWVRDVQTAWLVGHWWEQVQAEEEGGVANG